MEVQKLTIEDLMVGDWVEVDGEFTDVTSIDRTEINNGCMKEVDIRYVNPIPITPEILEKNGFKKMGFTDLYEWYKPYSNIIEITFNDGIYCHIGGRFCQIRCEDIKYVHELQHALRLCGIEKVINL